MFQAFLRTIFFTYLFPQNSISASELQLCYCLCFARSNSELTNELKNNYQVFIMLVKSTSIIYSEIQNIPSEVQLYSSKQTNRKTNTLYKHENREVIFLHIESVISVWLCEILICVLQTALEVWLTSMKFISIL